MGTLGALFAAKDQGGGQHVDVSLMETQAGVIDRRMATVVAYHYCGEVQGRTGLGTLGFPTGVYPCADGYFELVGGIVRWPQVVQMLGNPPQLQDPKWREPTAQQNPELKEEFDALFLPWVLERTKRELWDLSQAAEVLSAPLNTMPDVLADPYFNERGYFTQIAYPETGAFTFPGRPWFMHETPWQIRCPAPRLGEHNAELLGALGYSKEDLVKLRETNVI